MDMIGRITGPKDFKLFVINGTPINTFGTMSILVNLGLRWVFRSNFVFARVKQPIIGADFLRHFGLLVGLRNRRILYDNTFTLNNSNRYHRLLKDFICITKETQHSDRKEHPVEYHIVAKGPPVSERTK